MLLCLPGSLAAADLCHSATGRPFTFSEPASSLAQGEQRCYATDLPSAGIWLVDVSIDAQAETTSNLWISNEPCGRTEKSEKPATQVLYRKLNGALLRVLTPGRYLFCTSAQDPRFALGEHRVTSLFAPELAKGDPDEDEPDPHPQSSAHQTLPTACSQVQTDDVADLWACAENLPLGRPVDAFMGNAMGNDVDYFSLAVPRWTTIEVQSDPDAQMRGVLYDAWGYRLAVAQADTISGFRLVETLAPGSYFLRVEGTGGWEGPYRLTARALARP